MRTSDLVEDSRRDELAPASSRERILNIKDAIENEI